MEEMVHLVRVAHTDQRVACFTEDLVVRTLRGSGGGGGGGSSALRAGAGAGAGVFSSALLPSLFPA